MGDRFKKALENIKPTELEKNRMYQNILHQERLAHEKKGGIKMKNRRSIWMTGAAAALLMLVFSASFFMGKDKGDVLYSSNGVEVKEVSEVKLENTGAGAITMLFTEKDVFTLFDTDAFMGTVEDVKNISMNFDGIVHYRAMAILKVEKVYDGELTPGETVRVMLPGPVDTGQVMGADFNITRAMKPGERGIFLPLKYQNEEVWEENGKVLKMKDVAEYAILDTERFAFMETAEGLLFARDTFPKIMKATSLEEIETYIQEKISK